MIRLQKESYLDPKNFDTIRINERRKLWIQLCNENNSKNLVEELYIKNAIYYNRKPPIRSTNNLIKEYSYTNNKNYRLQLHPLTTTTVNANLVFEIGQCKGTYNGKYILVWEKDSDGK
ncbi:MAG: hypothetical protein BGN92_03695 [Sphingobacteriales bacterium 41-5]|nr:MAG: hypothetical protein BGN92_03695 [Sphingobacteriales bacterium 41-5]